MATDTQILLQGRALIETYRQTEPHDSAKIRNDLKALDPRFTSIASFYAFNDSMCIQALMALNIQGSCDLCKGYAGVPNCKVKFGASSCASTGIALTSTTQYPAILIRVKLGDFAITGDWNQSIANMKTGADKNGIYWFCRTGGGYYLNVKNAKSGQFSLTWK